MAPVTERRRWFSALARRFATQLPRVLLAALLAFSLRTGVIGLDFGRHWDEFHQFEILGKTLEAGLFVPRWHNYPSGSYLLTLSSLAPELAVTVREQGIRGLATSKATLRKTVESPTFHFRVRCTFLVVALLAIAWMYGAARAWGRTRWQALFAAALVGLSWQVGYHARWIAPDAVLMQFGALVLLLLGVARRRGPRPWLFLAAGAAGFACATKYPGGLLLVPVAIQAWLSWRAAADPSARSPKSILFGPLLAFAGAYYLVSPGTVLDPVGAWTGMTDEIHHYQSAVDFGGHQIEPGFPHLSRMLAYLGTAVFSPRPGIALGLSALALGGAIHWMRVDRRTAAVILAFPSLYLLYMSRQSAMVARNLLVMVPFLAILAAEGLAWVQRVLADRSVFRRAIYIVLLAALLFNAHWLERAAQSIRRRAETKPFVAPWAYIESHPATKFRLSPRAAAIPRGPGRARPANVVDAPVKDGVLVALLSEVPPWWPANRVGTYNLLPSGPFEIDLDMYPRWSGDDRVVLIPEASWATLR